MAWPTDEAATADLISAAQFNRICAQIANDTLSGTDTDFDLTSIPAHWTSLLLGFSGQCDAGSSQIVRLRFNNDSGSNYDSQDVAGVAAVASASEDLGQGYIRAGLVPDDTAGFLGQSFIWIPDYASTTLNKGVLVLYGTKAGTGSGNVKAAVVAGWWRSSSAISRITLSLGTGNFAAGSRVTLWGMGAG